ncbi:MAG: ATP-dependent helicase [Anaerolineales bacterium]|nr:ATP-dependent helicase [Anaerolineales bacterium]
MLLAQDLFDSPADLALAHKFAVVLRRIAAEHPDYRLPQFVEELAEIARNQRRFLGFDEDMVGFEPPPGKVTVATMHRAKGLEWDRVYLMGLNNYSFPSGQPQDTYFPKSGSSATRSIWKPKDWPNWKPSSTPTKAILREPPPNPPGSTWSKSACASSLSASPAPARS